MADYDSSLPVRTEADADERLQSKIVDFTTPSQGMAVDTDDNAHVEVHGNRADDAADIALELTEEGKAIVRGDYEADDNSEPSSVGLITSERSAAPAYTTMTKRLTSITGADNTQCLDVAIRDESGNVFSSSNPLPVSLEESEGTEVHDFEEDAAVASSAEAEHTYSVADGDIFLLYKVLASGSGKIKVELEIGDGAVSEAFAAKAITFNSTAMPQADISFDRVPIKVTGTVNTTTVKVTITNLDNQAQDVHSTIIGITN